MKTKIKAVFAVSMLLLISCKKDNSVRFLSANDSQQAVNTSYTSVTIGTQVWMDKNLGVSYYRNGDKIPQVTDSAKWSRLTTGAWCWYNNDSAKYAVYGKLYNWYAINDPRGLAPEGWHVSSDAEWLTTASFLSTHVGGKMKETGISHWFDPNIDATNSTGFTGLPGGYRSNTGQFCYVAYLGLWWTSTSYNSSVAWYRRMLCYSATLDRWRFQKRMGFSVRCIKD